MKLLVILFFVEMIKTTVLANIFQKYSLQIDTSIKNSISSLWLIGNYKLNSKLQCLSQCNLMKDCYSVTYNMDLISTNNCAMYSKIFEANELISLNKTNLYSQHCKKIIYLIFFTSIFFKNNSVICKRHRLHCNFE